MTDLSHRPARASRRAQFSGFDISAAAAALRVNWWRLIAVYVLLLAVSALLGRWTPEFLQGRSLWHFWATRMIVPMVAVAALAAFARLIPAGVMLAAALLFIGAISAIKRDATGEPFQISDLFLAGQSVHLLGYVSWDKWLMALPLLPAAWAYLRNLRVSKWSLPLFGCCALALSSYRLEPVAQFIHDDMGPWGLENLTFSQAESERMNGLATHLYFSAAGLRLKRFSPAEISAAMDRLDGDPPAIPAAAPLAPDIYIVLGEAWWRDPSDPHSPLDQLKAAGFAEGTGVSPVYGGTTPNAEFEVLTGVPAHSFVSGIIPYQHYVNDLSATARTLPRLLVEKGYTARAYHNFTRRFWLRDRVYPQFGFASFTSGEDMGLDLHMDQWPGDRPLYEAALANANDPGPQFGFLVTIGTHGPFPPGTACGVPAEQGACDYRRRLSAAAGELARFKGELDRGGRPYVILVFGDHLPGLRQHQAAIGMADGDPRLHETPFLVASSQGRAKAIRAALDRRPFYCFAPALTDVLTLGIEDRYFRHLVKHCGDGTESIPEEAVIEHQLFLPASGS